MNIFLLVWNYLKAKPLSTALNMLLLALGIIVITIIFLFNRQLQQKISENSKGIDLVVGAKGSPLQLILCNIFHIDFPTGNIRLADAESISKGRLVKKAIPLALGDSYQSYRIVGTTKDYADLYDAALADGEWWDGSMEVVIGATIAESSRLQIGDMFESTHGLTTAGHSHEEKKFRVKGVLRRSGNVIDNLILTSIESIWEIHEEHSAGEDEHETLYDPSDSIFAASPLVPSVKAGDSTREITSVLIQYRSPIAALQLPRTINGQTSLQAASPAFETARLFSILGIGIDILHVFAVVLIAISALSIFIALYNSLRERRYDLAIMRSMGAGRTKLLISVLLEGIVLTVSGCIAGMLLAHGLLQGVSMAIPEFQRYGLSGMTFYAEEFFIAGGSMVLGLICSVIPAIQAYRTDISKVLAG